MQDVDFIQTTPPSPPPATSLPRIPVFFRQLIAAYKGRFWLFVEYGLVMLVVIVIASKGLTFVYSVLSESAVRNGHVLVRFDNSGFMNEIKSYDTTTEIVMWIYRIVEYLLFLYLACIANTGIAYLASSDKKPTFRNVIVSGFRNAFSSMWITILAITTVLGFAILGVIPGIYFGVAMSVVVFVLVNEKIHGLNAIIRSKDLVKGHWWQVFGRGLLVSFVVFVPVSIYFLFSQIIYSVVYYGTAKITYALGGQAYHYLFVGWAFTLFSVFYLFCVAVPILTLSSGVLYKQLVSLKGTQTSIVEKRRQNILLSVLALCILVLLTSLFIWSFNGDRLSIFSSPRVSKWSCTPSDGYACPT